MGEDEKKEIKKIQAYKKMFGTPEGQVVLRDLLRNGGFFTGTFNESHSVMAFEEGRRSIVMEILRTTQVNVDEIINEFNRMEKENGQF